MKVGFTGTRRGMSTTQVAWLAKFLRNESVTEFHHGDCIGSDAEAHVIAESVLKYRRIAIHIHPPISDSKRAYKHGDVEYDAKPYLDRNRDIVDACDVLVACPGQPETLRSGTWATVRYARKIGKPVRLNY